MTLLEEENAAQTTPKGEKNGHSISVTVPVFNEAGNLVPFYERLAPVLRGLGNPWEIIFVNDGSHDGSREILDRIAAGDARVKVVHFRRRFGQTAAMMAGVDFAGGDIIIPMDADLQNDAEDIPRLLALLEEGFDVVSGWRKERKDHRFRRNFLSRVANTLISRISGVRLHDFGCSLKAYRKDVVKDIRLYGEMHRFIPIYASWQGARIAEIPVKHHPRTKGHSKYGMQRIFKVLLDLMVVKFLSGYAEKPMYIFGGVGLISLGVSFLSGIAALVLKIWHGVSFILTPLPLLSVLTAIIGLTAILQGFVAELVIRTYYESQGKRPYSVKETRNL